MSGDHPIIERVQDLLARYGSTTTSFQILEPGLEYWFSADDDACVAYADVSGAWIAAGEPIAAPNRTLAVMHEFVTAAHSAYRRVRFFAVEERVACDRLTSMCIGVQAVWDPSHWDEVVGTKRSLREQFRRARAKDVVVRVVAGDEIRTPESPMRQRIQSLIDEWKSARGMAPMQFLVLIHPFTQIDQRRYLVAELNGEVLGLVVAVPIFARSGWFLEDVLRSPRAPNGTMELLFDAAMRLLGGEGSRHVTFGLAPLAGVEQRLLRRIRDVSSWLYDFQGLYRFKKKLLPSSWQPVYLAYPTTEKGVSAIIDALRAFAGGSLVQFGWRTLLHRAPTVTRILAALLIPWTLGLAVSENMFPSHFVQTAWVALDVTLILGLLFLAGHWRAGLAVALALIALADGILGGLQAFTYNLNRDNTAFELLLICIATLAPLVAGIYLWCARDRRAANPPPSAAIPARHS